MIVKNVQSYIAQIIVISEIISVFQSIINVYGGGFSYFNLIVFSLLSLPLIFQIKIPIKFILLALVYYSAIFLKFLLQGAGEYYLKSSILLFMLPVYFILIHQTTYESIALSCAKYRNLILILGIGYVISWYFLGTYRNASTVTIFLMLILGYKCLWQLLISLVFAAVMKTQYKIWAALSILISIFSGKYVIRFVLLMLGFCSIVFPLLLSFSDISWVGFNDSQISSLEERLNEVRSFLAILSAKYEFIVYGWPVGSIINGEELSERGYMHSAYLWLIGTMGLPLFLSLLVYITFRRTSTKRCFWTRAFLVLSNSLTFLFLTNPFCTALMLANEDKVSR